jgi:hypothetical protein
MYLSTKSLAAIAMQLSEHEMNERQLDNPRAEQQNPKFACQSSNNSMHNSDRESQSLASPMPSAPMEKTASASGRQGES